MSAFVLICLTAFAGSCLTLFSGFGLGTLLLPVFALFFPLETAIAATAIVHLLNNLFKLLLLGRKVDGSVLLRFGLPALPSAFLGAWLLTRLTNLEPLLQYRLAGHDLAVMPFKLVVALLLIVFSLAELLPWFRKLQFDRKYLPLGGLLSGFFGGLSGHQGALRAAFLLRAGLSKEAFIATGTAIACGIDVARLAVYGSDLSQSGVPKDYRLLAAATLSAFAGAVMGVRLLKGMTIRVLQYIVAVLLLVFAVLLGMGFL